MRLQLRTATAALLLLPLSACGSGDTDDGSSNVSTAPTDNGSTAPTASTGAGDTTTGTGSTGSTTTGDTTTVGGDGTTVTDTSGDDGASGGTATDDTATDMAGTGVAAVMGCAGQTNDEETGNVLIAAAEANNYSFSSTLSFEPALVAPNGNLSFDWSALTKDFLGHPLNVADVQMVSLMLWRLNQADLEQKLNDDALAQSDLVNLAMFYPADLMVAHPDEGGTRAELLRPATDAETGEMYNASDLTLFMNPLAEDEFMPFFDDTAYPPENHTFTLIASTGTVAGEDTVMIQGFRLDPTSDLTEVVLTDESTQLTYDADLHSLTPTQIPAEIPNITVDWRDIATNSLGNEFSPTAIAEVQVAHFTETPEELEAKFLDLELIAVDMYKADVPAGTSFDLTGLTNEAGEPFAGIDGTGTWIIALVCGSCRNPAPWYISTLTPCGG
jgi:hypothetical protein